MTGWRIHLGLAHAADNAVKAWSAGQAKEGPAEGSSLGNGCCLPPSIDFSGSSDFLCLYQIARVHKRVSKIQFKLPTVCNVRNT
ncbi:MAG: hypothetical protein BJ554DRAFT_6258 [Olpidium bornovanus]|uniref:Uncharacterized protein n=1 Tax=Olpidium bornovanus TaxID=278681 RepID=A0A8H8A1T4_9FUNG|nr:MAG: hypothetical protein BJ554DRAFT_6258 [Olpidium bornovanus]